MTAGARDEFATGVADRRCEGSLYVFAVNMRNREVTGTVELPAEAGGRVEVLGEEREIEVQAGRFEEGFEGYGVRLWRVGEG